MGIPDSFAALGWIPFVVVTLVVLFFSWVYINYFKSKYDRDLMTTVTASLALAVTLFVTFLIPVDVFLVSYVKTTNGTFKDWVTNDTIQYIENSVMFAYYSLYGVIAAFMFIFLPFAYFYYESRDELSTVGSRVCGGLKYTVIFVVIASVLIIAGSFIPMKEQPPVNSTEWERLAFLFDELGYNRGEDMMSFVLSVLTVIGMCVFIIFGGYGMSALPCGMIKGKRSVHVDREEAQDKRVVLNARAALIRDKYKNNAPMNARDRSRLFDIEEELRLLDRRDAHLDQESGSWLSKCCTLLRPFAILGGVALTLVGLLVFLSLLLTNIDKAVNSLGPKMGYALPVRMLPNPIDIVFVYAQMVFPLDYILFSFIVIFLLACAMSALRQMGIWFLWIKMYSIRKNRTRPQGLLLMCYALMFCILAINVMVYSITPQYIMYGSQKFWGNASLASLAQNHTALELQQCTTNAPQDQCIMSRFSLLLVRFCYKAWIFGATYYWATWAFLLVVTVGSVVSIFRRRPSRVADAVQEDDFDESDEELLRV